MRTPWLGPEYAGALKDYIGGSEEEEVKPTGIDVKVRVRGAGKAKRKIRALTNEILETNVPGITGPTKTITDTEGNRFQIEYRGPVTRVTITLPNGIKARGNSKLHETDVYNKQFGEHLASVRASERVMRKYAKWLAKEGYRLANG